MNKIIAIAILLFATAYAGTTVSFEVQKTFSWFRIVKTLHYNFVVKGQGADVTKEVNEWYIIRGYFEKFSTDNERLIQVTNVVNGAETLLPPLTVTSKDADNNILHFDYNVPSECANSKTFKLEIEDLKWADKTKQLKAVYTCNDNEPLHEEISTSEGQQHREEVEPKLTGNGQSTKVKTVIDNPDLSQEAHIQESPLIKEVIETNEPILNENLENLEFEEHDEGFEQPIIAKDLEIVNNIVPQEHQEDRANPLLEDVNQALLNKVNLEKDLTGIDKEFDEERIVV